jgi:L-ascorbate metabolism protein UlaG (beta-lactamase superfamily)
MDIINTLYAPTHVILPIGGGLTMGPIEAAFAVSKYLTNAKYVIPMHYGTFPGMDMLPGTFD